MFNNTLRECFTSEDNLGISVHFNKKTGHIIFESPKGSVIFLTGKLAFQTGFESKKDIPSNLITKHHKKLVYGKRIQPPNPVNVNLGYGMLYIYTDCVEQQLVGDVQAQCLRNVCVNNADPISIQTT